MLVYEQSLETRAPYPTDVTDDEWLAIEPLLFDVTKAGRKRSVHNREIVNAVLYMWQSGCSWRMLPHDFPSWPKIYYYYRRWNQDGTLRDLRELMIRLRRQPARERL